MFDPILVEEQVLNWRLADMDWDCGPLFPDYEFIIARLIRARVRTIRELAECSEHYLLGIPRITPKILEILRSVLIRFGYQFGMRFKRAA